jgi:hypothetical protein
MRSYSCSIATTRDSTTIEYREDLSRGEDVDHLPIAVIGTGELAPHALHRRGQHPVLEGCAVAQGAGLAGEHRHVMPGVINRVATAE